MAIMTKLSTQFSLSMLAFLCATVLLPSIGRSQSLEESFRVQGQAAYKADQAELQQRIVDTQKVRDHNLIALFAPLLQEAPGSQHPPTIVQTQLSKNLTIYNDNLQFWASGDAFAQLDDGSICELHLTDYTYSPSEVPHSYRGFQLFCRRGSERLFSIEGALDLNEHLLWFDRSKAVYHINTAPDGAILLPFQKLSPVERFTRAVKNSLMK
jgi:hypothetical protein